MPLTWKVEVLSPDSGGGVANVRMGDRIAVHVRHLDSLLALKNDTGTLILFMNKAPVTGIKADFYDQSEGVVFFTIERVTDQTDPWDLFYTSPLCFKQDHIAVSVGYYDTGIIRTEARAQNKCLINLVIIRKGYFWIAVVLICLVLLLFYYSAKRGFLRDDCQVENMKDKPFSLSRTQLAVWTVIVAVSYIFIALVTGELAPLTTSTLMLLGISGATSAVAGIIDNNDKLNGHIRQQDLGTTHSFLSDILSDSNGVSVHRFQMVVFNMILGIFFFKQVLSRLEMPEFDSNLLILMGISNATYTGLKTNENRTPAAPAQAIAQPAANNGEEIPAVG